MQVKIQNVSISVLHLIHVTHLLLQYRHWNFRNFNAYIQLLILKETIILKNLDIQYLCFDKIYDFFSIDINYILLDCFALKLNISTAFLLCIYIYMCCIYIYGLYIIYINIYKNMYIYLFLNGYVNVHVLQIYFKIHLVQEIFCSYFGRHNR